jgi:hypothetical protein
VREGDLRDREFQGDGDESYGRSTIKKCKKGGEGF